MITSRAVIHAFAFLGSPLAAASAQIRRDTIPLSEIVVTATRVPVRRDAVTGALTVLYGDELRSRGIATVAEALRLVPGAAVVETGSFGSQTSLFLRGGESDYTRILVDGVPVNQPGGSFDLAHLTTDNVERIEILRGPAGVLYGSDAVSGVVNVLTRRGSGSARMSAAAKAGTFGTFETSFELSEGTEHASLSLGLSRFASDGTLPLNNGYRRTAAAGQLVVRPDGWTEVAFTVRRTDGTFRFPTDAAGLPTDSNQRSGSLGTTLGIEASRQLPGRLDLKLTLGSHQGTSRFENRPDSPGDPESGTARAVQRRRSADLRLSLRAAGTVATVGALVEDERVNSASAYRSAFGPFGAVTRAERVNRAWYGELLSDIGRLSLQAGSRLEDNQRFGTFTTVRAGLLYRTGAASRMRASFGTSFKEPTFDENYGSGYGDIGNATLSPERSSSWEVGLEQALLGGRLRAGATWFEQRFRDMIQFTFNVPPGAPNYANVAGARAGGLEIEGRADLGRGIEIEARYTWLSTEAVDSGFGGLLFAEGERLIRRPSHSGLVSAAWRGEGPFVLGLMMLYTGDRTDLDFSQFPAARVMLGGQVRLDAHASLNVVRGIEVTARVENLAGRLYQEVLGFPARGRSVLVGIRGTGSP